VGSRCDPLCRGSVAGAPSRYPLGGYIAGAEARGPRAHARVFVARQVREDSIEQLVWREGKQLLRGSCV